MAGVLHVQAGEVDGNTGEDGAQTCQGARIRGSYPYVPGRSSRSTQ